MSLAVLLLLADGRLPAGGHAHSGGLEEAVSNGRVRDTDDLASYLRGRLATVGRVDAALAVAAWTQTPDWLPVDAEAAARCPSPAWRGVSRRQGRGLVRVARRMWTGEDLDAPRQHQLSPPDRCGRLQWGRLEPLPPWRRPRWLWWRPMPR